MYSSLPREDIAIIKRLAAFGGVGDYPTDCPPWEVDTAFRYTGDLLDTLSQSDFDYYGRSFSDGVIIVREYENCEIMKSLADFEAEFLELSDEYKNHVYEDCEYE